MRGGDTQERDGEVNLVEVDLLTLEAAEAGVEGAGQGGGREAPGERCEFGPDEGRGGGVARGEGAPEGAFGGAPPVNLGGIEEGDAGGEGGLDGGGGVGRANRFTGLVAPRVGADAEGAQEHVSRAKGHIGKSHGGSVGGEGAHSQRWRSRGCLWGCLRAAGGESTIGPASHPAAE